MAIAADRRLPKALCPGCEPLRRPHVMEQLRGRQGIKVRFSKPAGQLCPLRLGRKADAFPFPRDVLRGPPGNELAEQVVHHSWTHRLQWPVRGARVPGRKDLRGVTARQAPGLHMVRLSGACRRTALPCRTRLHIALPHRSRLQTARQGFRLPAPLPAGFMGGSPGRSSPGSGCSGRRHFHTRHAIRTYIRIQGMLALRAPLAPAVTSDPGAACETIWS